MILDGTDTTGSISTALTTAKILALKARLRQLDEILPDMSECEAAIKRLELRMSTKS